MVDCYGYTVDARVMVRGLKRSPSPWGVGVALATPPKHRKKFLNKNTPKCGRVCKDAGKVMVTIPDAYSGGLGFGFHPAVMFFYSFFLSFKNYICFKGNVWRTTFSLLLYWAFLIYYPYFCFIQRALHFPFCLAIYLPIYIASTKSNKLSKNASFQYCDWSTSPSCVVIVINIITSFFVFGHVPS